MNITRLSPNDPEYIDLTTGAGQRALIHRTKSAMEPDSQMYLKTVFTVANADLVQFACNRNSQDGFDGIVRKLVAAGF